eukprot:CAMPEP_0173411590 /NCGR_PEP_ID=MMETSP1356-20130122/77396_1 /TAXON_ID=77927 ORGANISM="Hemiselmis virescens, Strain PCC157" /NCGR_SAMPLE_ID=MMETSP1356 /ASSEMBLY_ACC=CAM_ASM_000847 /LENGTH=63 /DNA_ID=CAMNT_0014373375 /DNA_START=1 /DNA_END=188 /DNA_ORIENTATION=-
MFLSNKWNIKEVLLFPAMKPTQELADRAKSLHKTAAPGSPPSTIVPATSALLAGADLSTEAGL